ncbi:5-histidylcysteine sulfoxide synthase [Arcobacteraceae bacterium]|nr:5-histidylcysteine sulfoxide synthase [Arcobacteraceae bacterium]
MNFVNGSLYPVTLDGNDIALKRKEIKKYFHDTFDTFEKVFEVLKDDEVFYQQSEITRHPMIFYFGHTATFFINKLINMRIIENRLNANFESIFAIGVDEMMWDDTDSKRYTWPAVQDVRDYRDEVRKVVDNLIDTLPLTLPINQNSPMWIILMGIEHEKIHIETSLVLHRQMPLEFIQDSDYFNVLESSNNEIKNEMVTIPSVHIKLGIEESTHNLYSWDNEYGHYEEAVKEFKTSKYLVSNAEFMEFVNADGYKETKYWSEEGQKFLEITKATHPTFWVKEKDTYKYRTLTKLIDMPLNFPADVNALEAEAFCNYKSELDNVKYTLPSEVEYKAICKHVNLENLLDFPTQKANQNLINFSSCDVDTHEFNGIYDVVGNVWQWSRTATFGFEGFEPHVAYDDFSTPTFDDKHALILGSSWASSGNLIMNDSRYAFRRHFFQNAGFRYVITNNEDKKDMDIYESDALVSQYCEFQYGDTHFGVENFAIECAKIAEKFTVNTTKALDLGCATGRATYELAKTFDAVEGIDFSVRFVQVGTKLKEDGVVTFQSPNEAELFTNKKVTIEELGYEEEREKVTFWQGDACNLKPNFHSYDMILATNLIDRLYQPRLFLDTVSERLNDDGILILTSPYTWQESSTKKEFWLGGYKDENGDDVNTIDTLKTILNDKFELLHVQDLDFVIKETKRKYQHTVSEVSVWKKK